jgi:hypothetical protein
MYSDAGTLPHPGLKKGAGGDARKIYSMQNFACSMLRAGWFYIAGNALLSSQTGVLLASREHTLAPPDPEVVSIIARYYRIDLNQSFTSARGQTYLIIIDFYRQCMRSFVDCVTTEISGDYGLSITGKDLWTRYLHILSEVRLAF